jgi:hypothetical protein
VTATIVGLLSPARGTCSAHVMRVMIKHTSVFSANANTLHNAAQTSSQLGICLGNGDGTFESGFLVSTVAQMLYLVALDSNDDGFEVRVRPANRATDPIACMW